MSNYAEIIHVLPVEGSQHDNRKGNITSNCIFISIIQLDSLFHISIHLTKIREKFYVCSIQFKNRKILNWLSLSNSLSKKPKSLFVYISPKKFLKIFSINI